MKGDRMKLIDEIEAQSSPERKATALLLRWNAIKVALLAGKEMTEQLGQGDYYGACNSADRFLAATEEERTTQTEPGDEEP